MGPNYIEYNHGLCQRLIGPSYDCQSLLTPTGIFPSYTAKFVNLTYIKNVEFYYI
jgi:hypothetical protein